MFAPPRSTALPHVLIASGYWAAFWLVMGIHEPLANTWGT